MSPWEPDFLATIEARPLRLGDPDGLPVRRWRARLRRKGFAVAEHGDFDAPLRNATIVAQTWAGVEPDGLVGPETWRAVGAKRRTKRPLSTVRALAGWPKVIDARAGRAGFPKHRTRTWERRVAGVLVAKLGHHTGGPASFVADARFHVESDYLTRGGAPAIAYTFGADMDGTLFVFNDWQAVTWHCDGGKNTVTLGFAVRGNYQSERPPLAARRTLARVWRELEAGTFRPFPGEPAWPRLVPSTTHRHVNATSCPGDYGEHFYRSISPDFRESL